MMDDVVGEDTNNGKGEDTNNGEGERIPTMKRVNLFIQKKPSTWTALNLSSF